MLFGDDFTVATRTTAFAAFVRFVLAERPSG
jgi:hypothetical protein